MLTLAGEACTPVIGNLPKLFCTHSLDAELMLAIHHEDTKDTEKKPNPDILFSWKYPKSPGFLKIS